MNKQRKRFFFIGLPGIILAAMSILSCCQCVYSSPESAAILRIRTIQRMQSQYSAQHGTYATELAELGPNATGEVAAGKKNGYILALTGSHTGYVIHADPETYNSTGRRSFYSDESMVVRQNWGPEPATVQSPELK